MNGEKGLLHLYCGDGKGKTTAALGLCLRAAGCGNRVLLVQFLKGGQTGELAALAQIPQVTVLRGKAGAAFSFRMTEQEKEQTRRIHSQNLARAAQLVQAGQVDLLVLDEAAGACNRGLLDLGMLLQLLDSRPEGVEVVITGRNPDEALRQRADYISEIRKVRHPFDRGVKARRGVEF